MFLLNLYIGAGILFMVLFPLIVYLRTSSTKWLIASVISILPIALAIIYMKKELNISADNACLHQWSVNCNGDSMF